MVAEGRRAAERGEHAAAIARFDEALALWRGPALAEFADRAFARTEAAGLDELRASIAEERIAAVLAAGDHRDAVAECEKLVAEEPLRERRWTQLMLALYRDGRQGEALEAFRRLRTVLADELGVDPGPEARRLRGRSSLRIRLCWPSAFRTASGVSTFRPCRASVGSGSWRRCSTTWLTPPQAGVG